MIDLKREEFSLRLKAKLEEKNLSQYMFAKNMGVEIQVVHNWVRAKTFPDLYNFANICDYLGVSADYMIFGDKTKEESEGKNEV